MTSVVVFLSSAAQATVGVSGLPLPILPAADRLQLCPYRWQSSRALLPMLPMLQYW